MSAPIRYFPAALSLNANDCFRLLSELAWVRHGTTPRMEYFVSRIGLPYSYGVAAYARTYEPQPTSPAIEGLWKDAERLAETTFDVCFLNRYLNQSDHLGWHADDSPEMDDARPIAIISLGAERDILFRRYSPLSEIVVNGNELEAFPPPAPQRLHLAHGSVCVMAAGMQDTHQHRIPKASRICGERISLTFRGYAKP